MSWKSEREAREKADEILRRASGRGEDVGGDYGSGRLTKAQKKSQEKHIPVTRGPDTAGKKIARKLWG
jgi:hypothetical protein